MKTLQERIILKMDKKDLRALFVMVGSFVAYWVFCLVVIAQSFANSQ